METTTTNEVMTVEQIGRALREADQGLAEAEARLTTARSLHADMLGRYGADSATGEAVRSEQDEKLAAIEGEVAAAAATIARQARHAMAQLERAASQPALTSEEQARAAALRAEVAEDAERFDAVRLRDRITAAVTRRDRAAMHLLRRYAGLREWHPAEAATPEEARAMRELPHLLAQIDAQLRDRSLDTPIARAQAVLDRALAVESTAGRSRIQREAAEAVARLLPPHAVTIPEGL